jgi:metallo-beta-lactamase class B
MPVRTRASAPAALLAALLAAVPATLAAQTPGATRDAARNTARADTTACGSCREWNAPQRPFRIHGNSWYVGTRGLSAVLVTSPQGHVLIDGGLPESAAPIAANVRALGFRMEDVRLILNSHAHFDHAGGIAALQRASRAAVAAHPWSAAMMRRGSSLPEDPQYEIDIPYPAVPTVRVLADGETVRVGPLALTAHFTGGHTPGGTSWSWRSCEGDRCLDLVYADSQTPVSADGYLFTRSTRYPSVLDDFARGFATLERLRCDVLVTPHPSASTLFERLAAREQGRADAFRDDTACRRYAAAARQRLAQRVATERAAP